MCSSVSMIPMWYPSLRSTPIRKIKSAKELSFFVRTNQGAPLPGRSVSGITADIFAAISAFFLYSARHSGVSHIHLGTMYTSIEVANTLHLLKEFFRNKIQIAPDTGP